MSGFKFVNRLLSNQFSREKALEFARVFLANAGCEYRPVRLGDCAGPLDLLLDEARTSKVAPRNVAEYLAVREKREFAKLFLLCLAGSIHWFQPGNGPEWRPYRELLEDLCRDSYLLDPVAVGGMDRDDLSKEDPGEYLLEPLGEHFIWTTIRERCSS